MIWGDNDMSLLLTMNPFDCKIDARFGVYIPRHLMSYMYYRAVVMSDDNFVVKITIAS